MHRNPFEILKFQGRPVGLSGRSQDRIGQWTPQIRRAEVRRQGTMAKSGSGQGQWRRFAKSATN